MLNCARLRSATSSRVALAAKRRSGYRAAEFPAGELAVGYRHGLGGWEEVPFDPQSHPRAANAVVALGLAERGVRVRLLVDDAA